MGQSAVIACSDIDELQQKTPGSDLPANQGSILSAHEEVSTPVVSKSSRKPMKGQNIQRRRVQSTKTSSLRESAVTVLNEKNPFRIEENKALYDAFERRTNRTKSWVEKNQSEKVPAKKPEENPFDRMTNKILHQAYERRTKRVETLVAGYSGTASPSNPFRTTEESSPPVNKKNRVQHGGARRPMIEVNSDDETNPFTVARNPNSPNSRSFRNIQNPNNPRSHTAVGNISDPNLRSESEDSIEFLLRKQPEEAANNEESNGFDSLLQSSKNEVKDSPVSGGRAKNNKTEHSSWGNEIFGNDIFDTKKKSNDVMDIFGAEDNTGGEDFFKVDNQEKAEDQNGIFGNTKARNYTSQTRKSRSIFEDAAKDNGRASNRGNNPFDLYEAKESSTKVFLDPDTMFDSKNEKGNVEIDVEKTSTQISKDIGQNNRASRKKQNATKKGGHFTEKGSDFTASIDMDSDSDELFFVKKEVKQTALSHKDGDSNKDVADWLFNDY